MVNKYSSIVQKKLTLTLFCCVFYFQGAKQCFALGFGLILNLFFWYFSFQIGNHVILLQFEQFGLIAWSVLYYLFYSMLKCSIQKQLIHHSTKLSFLTTLAQQFFCMCRTFLEFLEFLRCFLRNYNFISF